MQTLTYQILTNDDEVFTPSISSIFLAYKLTNSYKVYIRVLK